MNRRHRVAASLCLATAELGAATSCTPGPAPAHIAHAGDEPDTLTVQGWVLDEVRATSTTATIPPATATTESPTTTTTEPEPAPIVSTIVSTIVSPRRPTTTVYEPPAPQGQSTRQGGAPLACIRSYEGDYGTNTGNGYYGAYQFDLATWRSVGGTGLPSDASPAEQDMRAQMLYDRRGLAPWPTPAAMCR